LAQQGSRADWSRKYRVVQWATGNVGARSLRRVIEHPGLDLVGVWVSNPVKVGRDAGELAGVAPIGIKAITSIDEVIALKPDCVLYMPHVNRIDEVCRLLESGANIVSTRMEYQNPAGLEPADRARIEEACRKGRSSIHASGSSPGFITEALPIVLTSLARRLDCLTIYEYGYSGHRNSPEMLFGPMMGFAAPPGDVNPHVLEHMRGSFAPSLNLVAEALGLSFDDVRVHGEQALARKDTQLVAGLVPAGTVAATRTTVECLRGGKPIMRFIANWFVTSDVDTPNDEPWDFRDSGWRVVVEGDTPLDIVISFQVPPDEYAEFAPNLTAHRPINAIPYVCTANPGFVTTIDLPQVVAKLG
jgi:hypothetical protein